MQLASAASRRACVCQGHASSRTCPLSAQPGRQLCTSRRLTRQQHRATAAAAGSAPTAEPVVDFLGVVNDMQTARGVIHTAADPDHVYGILTDYGACPRVFRSVARSQTVYTEQGCKQVLQAGKWQFLFFKGTFDVRLDVSEVPDDRSIVFTLAESTFMKNFEGRWQVQSLPGGGSSAEYVLAVQPLFPIPAAVAPYTSGIFKQQVADLLEDVQAELDRQAGRQLED